MGFDLQGFSDAAADAVAKAGASVVRVEGRHRSNASGIVWNADGLIVTANHVVEMSDGIRVSIEGETTVEATIVGRDPNSDIALLRVQASGLTPAEWLPNEEVRTGGLVWAVARPGRRIKTALGTVVKAPHAGGKGDPLVLTDVTMFPGYSGGALGDASGRVVGLLSSWLRRDESAALPYETVKRVVETLAAHGKMPRGYLGVTVQPVRLSESLAQQVGQETGLILMSAESGGPAAQAGLVQGDVLLKFGDANLRQLDDLQKNLALVAAGAHVPIAYVRGGELSSTTATIGAR